MTKRADRTDFTVTCPNRVDLAGGTLDLFPLHLFLEGPAVTVNLAIDVYSRVRVRRLPRGGRRYVSEDAPGQTGLHRRAAALHELPPHFMLSSRNEAPRGSGLGASSALLMALLRACEVLSATRRGAAARVELASRLEAAHMGTPTGQQDYWAAQRGGLLALHWEPAGTRVRALLPDRARHGDFARELQARLLIADTRIAHHSGLTNWGMLQAWIAGDRATRRGLEAIRRIAWEMATALEAQDLEAATRLLAEEWRERRRLAPGVSSPGLDRIVGLAARHGGAAKLCGAGGGGFLVALVPPERRVALAEGLARAGCAVRAARIAWRGLSVTRHDLR